MEFKHKCLYCSSPCEVTLAISSEGCTNPKCRAHKPAPKAPTDNPQQGYFGDNPCNGCDEASRAAKEPRLCPPCSHSLEDHNAGAPEDDPAPYNIATRTGRFDCYGQPYRDGKKPPPPEGNLRHLAKRASFSDALRYCGSTSAQLSKELGITFEESDRLRREHLEAFPKIMREVYIARRLRWPQTMRVVDRETQSKKLGTSKDSFPLLGVLSLVDVPQELEGQQALYEYISVSDPVSGRGRVIVTHFHSSTGSSHTKLRLKTYNPAHHAAMRRAHVPAILKEFEIDKTRDRPARRANEAEAVMFGWLRKPT